MSYAALIDRNLTRAFNKIRDLAKVATVTKRNNVEFNFGTGEKSSTDTIVKFKCVLIEDDKNSEERNSKELQIMFKTSDMPELTTYDNITIEGTVYKVGKALKSDGYISIVTIHREA